MNKQFFMMTMLMSATILAVTPFERDREKTLGVYESVETPEKVIAAPIENTELPIVLVETKKEEKKIPCMLITEAEESLIEAVKKNCPDSNHDDCIIALIALFRNHNVTLLKIDDAATFSVPTVFSESTLPNVSTPEVPASDAQ